MSTTCPHPKTTERQIRFASEDVDEITLDPDGTVGVWTLYQWVERSTNGVVWLNGNRVQ